MTFMSKKVCNFAAHEKSFKYSHNNPYYQYIIQL